MGTIQPTTAKAVRAIFTWRRNYACSSDDAQIATNFQGVSPVSSGGPDGNAPGVWPMLSNSVRAGLSTNNPDRFGWRFAADKCPSASGQRCLCEVPGIFTGGAYPQPSHNFQGYMFYEAPRASSRSTPPLINRAGRRTCAPYGGSGADDGTGGYTGEYPQGTERPAFVVPDGATPPNLIADGQVATNLSVPDNIVRSINFPHNLPAPKSAPHCPSPPK
jgi:hypothetical protein